MNAHRLTHLLLAALCLLVWTSAVLATPRASGVESPSGGIMGGTADDANAFFDSGFEAGSRTAAWTHGDIFANDTGATKSISGGAYDFNQFTGLIEGCDNARWTASFFARMILRTDAVAPANYSDSVKARSRAELLMWGNLNLDGWDAREIQNTNMQSKGSYDIYVTLEGQSRTIAQGGMADEIGTNGGPQVDLSDNVLIAWDRYRDERDVQFTYESVSSGELVLEFSDVIDASVACVSRHPKATDGLQYSPFFNWEVEVFAWNMDVPGGQIIEQYALE